MRKVIAFRFSDDLTCLTGRPFFWMTSLLLLVVFNLTVPGTSLAEDNNEVSHILYINSYHPGYSWSDTIEQGLRESIKSSGRKIEISTEYLDTRRFTNPTLQNKLADIVLAKHRDFHHKLIIVSDNAAFDFAIKNRERFFPDIPIVFCGYNNFRSELLRGLINITGVNEEMSIGGLIETALFIQPNIRTLAFIVSTGDTSNKIIADLFLKSIVPQYQDQYQIIILKDASMSRIKETLVGLSSESALFLLGQTIDMVDGRAPTPVESGRLISAISPVPAYTLWDFHLDTGVLGGRILTGYDQGKAVGDMALQILNGKKAEKIPVLMESPTSYAFDYRVMKRFSIAMDALPKKSTVINKPYSAYEANKKIVWATIIVIASLSALVIGLFFNIFRRQRAEKELQKHRDHLEELVKERTAELSESNKALKDSEGRFRSLSDAAFEGIVISEKGSIREVNEAMIRMFGYEHQDFIGMSATDLVDPDLREEVSKKMISGYELPYESNCLKKDGNLFPVEVHGKMFSYKNHQVRVTAIRDISDRERIKEEQKNALDRLVAVWDSIDAIVYVADMDSYEILFLNRYGQGVFGEAVGKICWQVFHKDQAEPCAFCTNKYLLDSDGNPTETRAWEMQNSLNGRWYLIRDKAIKWIDGRIVRIQIATDITERVDAEREKLKLEAQNLQLQKVESLDRMAGAIAHHFNNKLHVVMGNLELALGSLLGEDNTTHYLTEAIQAADKAAEVSRLMLTYLGKVSGKQASLDLSEICRRSLPLIQADMPKHLTLETDLTSPGPTIKGNANQIQLILTNIIRNSWEAVGDNQGTIHLSIKMVASADISSAHRFPINWQANDNEYVCLEVRDTGCGIAAKDLEAAFDPFFSTKFTGRGLGLSVVLGLVQAHSGGVTVESAADQGSVVSVYFPIFEEEVSSQPERVVGTPEILGTGTVLLVDDDQIVLLITGELLSMLGFKVLTAMDGIEAVEVFQRYKGEIRFVLSDIAMPRMNGLEMLNALRQIAPGIPVILASGYSEEQVMDLSHPEQPQAFLEKPFGIQELQEAIGQTLAARYNGSE